MRRRLIVALALFVFCSCSGTVIPVLAQPDPAGDELVRLRYADEEFIYATVKMFDENAIFLIDTGATRTLLDSRYQDRLGERLTDTKLFQTAVGAAVVPYYRSPVMHIVTDESETDLIVPFVGVADFRSVQATLDQPIAGLIGMDFLKDHTLRLNLGEHYAALVRAPRNTSAEEKRIDFGGSDSVVPSIRLLISGDKFEQFLLDTGGLNTCICLEPKIFERLKRRGQIIPDGASVTAGIGGFADLQQGILEQVELGDIQVRNVGVSSGQRNFIGLEFFERFETELDFPNRKAYFRPESRIRGPIRRNLSHFGVKIVNNKLVVVGCRGIAQDAGIRVNDVLVRINGRPARERTISEFRNIQCLPDSELNLSFDRNGKAFDVSLKLKQPPNPFPDDLPEEANEPPKK